MPAKTTENMVQYSGVGNTGVKPKWDGKSRIPTDQYKKNYDEIFKKKKETRTRKNIRKKS